MYIYIEREIDIYSAGAQLDGLPALGSQHESCQHRHSSPQGDTGGVHLSSCSKRTNADVRGQGDDEKRERGGDSRRDSGPAAALAVHVLVCAA